MTPAIQAEPRLEVDAKLRPEGQSGPLVRSFDAYQEYYKRWVHVWERQALLRAAPMAGADELAADFMAMADEVRYGEPIGEDQVREIRRIKARVEAERLPRGADPARHLKLGRGSLSDVEWLVQLIQLQHAASIPALRTTSTRPALQAIAEAGHHSGGGRPDPRPRLGPGHQDPQRRGDLHRPGDRRAAAFLAGHGSRRTLVRLFAGGGRGDGGRLPQGHPAVATGF